MSKERRTRVKCLFWCFACRLQHLIQCEIHLHTFRPFKMAEIKRLSEHSWNG